MTQTNMPGLMLFGSGTGPKDRLQTSVGLLSGTGDEHEARHWLSALSQALQPVTYPNECEKPLQPITACGKEDTAIMPEKVRRGDTSLVHVLGGLAIQPTPPSEPSLQLQIGQDDDSLPSPEEPMQEDVFMKEDWMQGALSQRVQAPDVVSKDMAPDAEAVPSPKLLEVASADGEAKTDEDNGVSVELQNGVGIGDGGELTEIHFQVERVHGIQVQGTDDRNAKPKISSADSAKAGAPHTWFRKSLFDTQTPTEFESQPSGFGKPMLSDEVVKDPAIGTAPSLINRKSTTEDMSRTSVAIPGNWQEPLPSSAGKSMHDVRPSVDTADSRLSTAKTSTQNNTFDASISMLQGELSAIHHQVEGVQQKRVQGTDRRQASLPDPLKADSPDTSFAKGDFGLYPSMELETQSSDFGKTQISGEDETPLEWKVLSFEERDSKRDDPLFRLADIREDASKPGTASGGKPVDEGSPQVDAERIHATIRNAVLHHPEGTSEMRIVLKPEWLGSMTMRIQIHDGKVQVHIATERQESRELIQTQVPLLRSELEGKGLIVETIRVEVSGGRAESHSGAAMGQWASQRDGREPERALVKDSIESLANEKQEAPYQPVILETIPKGRLSAFA